MRAWTVLVLFTLLGFAGCISSGSGTDDAEQHPTPDPAPAFLPEVASLRDAILQNGTVTVEAETATLRGIPDPRYQLQTSFEVALEPSPLLNGATWAEVDGVAVDLPFVEAYRGHVVGHEDQPVRLTLTHDWAGGTVRVEDQNYRIRINMDGNFPTGYPLAVPEAGGQSARVAPARILESFTFDRDGVEPHDCLSLAPTDHSPVIPGVVDAEEMVARIVLDGDGAYLARLEDHAFPLMVAFLNEVDAIFDHQLGIRFEVVGLHLHTDLEAMSRPEDKAPLGDLSAYWNAREDVPRDMVHLYTGWESSYAQANCIGGAGMPKLAYTFTTIQWAESDFGLLRHTQTYAHELGHIFNAHHHYGNPVEGGISTTIMHQGGEKVNPAFSTVSRDVIRGWAEAHVNKDA